jgi:hypothetical protein
MGMYEDDRIRSKNRIHNEAYELFESMRAKGYTDGDIKSVCASVEPGDEYRNEIYSMILKIIGGSHGEST